VWEIHRIETCQSAVTIIQSRPAACRWTDDQSVFGPKNLTSWEIPQTIKVGKAAMIAALIASLEKVPAVSAGTRRAMVAKATTKAVAKTKPRVFMVMYCGSGRGAGE